MPWWSCRWRLPDKMAISQTPKYLVNACSTASGFSEWVAHFMYNFIHLSIAVEMWKHIRTFTFKCQHSLAPPYLSNQLQQVARMEPRQRLRSSTLPALVVPPTGHGEVHCPSHVQLRRSVLCRWPNTWKSVPSDSRKRSSTSYVSLRSSVNIVWHHPTCPTNLNKSLEWSPDNVWDHRVRQRSSYQLLLLLVCVSFTITGQPRNSVLIRRV